MMDTSLYSGPQWQRLAIHDIDEAHAFIRRAFLDVNVTFSEPDPAARGLVAVGARLGDVSLTRMKFPTRTRLTTAPDGDVNITHMIRGRNSLSHGKDTLHFGPADNYLVSPDHSQKFDFADVDLFSVGCPVHCSKTSPTPKPVSAAPTCASTARNRSPHTSGGTGHEPSPM